MNGRRLLHRRGFALGAVAFAAFLVAVAVGWVEALAFGALAFGDRPAPDLINIVYDIGGGLTFAIVGFVVWWRRPGNVTGPLMVLVGVALLAWVLEWVPVPPLVTLGQLSWGAVPVLIGALLILYPSGKVASRLDRAWLVGAAVLLAIGVVHALVSPIGKWTCPACHSWIVLSYDETLSNDIWLLKMNLLAVLGVALIALLARRWLGASRPLRRVMTPLWVAGVAFVVVALGTVVLDTSGFTANVFTSWPNTIAALRLQMPSVVWVAIPFVDTVALFLIPLSLLWGQIRSRWGQVAVSALASQLGRTEGRPSLVELLRQALGDPSLELALWSRPAGAYVSPDGLPVALPEGDSARAVTRLDGNEGPLAAMVHDPALAEQPQLIDGVSAVAQLADRKSVV